MLRLATTTAMALLLALGQARAQLTVTVGPTAAALGGDVLACVTNDTASMQFIGSIGPVRVLDANGSQVYFLPPLAILIAIPVAPGEAQIYTRWGQVDSSGNQVPPGAYTMEVTVNGATSSHIFTVGGIDAALTPIGTLTPGAVRTLYCDSPQDPGLIYGYAASLTANSGIPTCAGTVPLDNDPLLAFSTTPNNGVFFNTVGLLEGPADPDPGSTMAPTIAVPNDPMLSGFSFNVAFFVIDFLAPCPVARISGATTLTIL